MFDRLRIPKASDIVIDKIKEEIAEGRLKPGMRLPSERDLATTMGVSRPVIREALRMLRFMGIVEMKPGTSGALLLDGDIDVLSDSLTLVLDLKQLGYSEAMVVRRALEPLAAELAAAHRGPEHLQEMAEVLEGLRSGRYHHAEFSAAIAHFHVTVAEASGNLLVSTMMKAISRLIFRNAEMYLRTEDLRQIAIRNWLAVYQAIADADPCLARAKMEQYLDEATSVMEAMRLSAAPPGVETRDLVSLPGASGTP